jgi:ABC-type uncharacterized transport system permease subunit
VALMADKSTGGWIVIAILLAGVVGGMVWAGITGAAARPLQCQRNPGQPDAGVRGRPGAQLPGVWPLERPGKGYNFPQTKTFESVTQIPRMMAGIAREHRPSCSLLACCAALWVFLFRTRAGFAQQVGGLAPAAARYAGFSSRKALWTALLTSGGAAGLAGALEVAGPIGQLTPYVPCRLRLCGHHRGLRRAAAPGGHDLSAILMSMFYIGGELAQSRLGLPKSLTGVFQGLLLFTLLACDTLIATACAGTPRCNRGLQREHRGPSMESYALLMTVAATLNAGTVLAIAGLGLLINEKAGIVNLGAEGMMLCAAIGRVCHRGAHRQRLAGLCGRHGAGALLAAIFGCWSSGSTPTSTPRAGAQPVRRRASRPLPASSTCRPEAA